jgi:DNA-binding CsgD family transcriptional regulator
MSDFPVAEIPHPTNSHREMEIIRMTAQGMLPKSIARTFFFIAFLPELN